MLFFPKIIKGFQQLYPDITIKLIEYGANRVQKAVEKGELDLGVAVLPVNEHLLTLILLSQKNAFICSPLSPFSL